MPWNGPSFSRNLEAACCSFPCHVARGSSTFITRLRSAMIRSRGCRARFRPQGVVMVVSCPFSLCLPLSRCDAGREAISSHLASGGDCVDILVGYRRLRAMPQRRRSADSQRGALAARVQKSRAARCSGSRPQFSACWQSAGQLVWAMASAKDRSGQFPLPTRCRCARGVVGGRVALVTTSERMPRLGCARPP